MSYEWVGVVATAAVGLAGITATWLLARANRADQIILLRMQHEEARKAALRETKRRAYGELSANLSALALYAAMHSQHDEERTTSIVQELMRSLGTVEVLGSPLVIQMAPQVTAKAMELLAGALAGNIEHPSEWDSGIKNQLFMLRRLMANDLGISTDPSLDEVKGDIDTLKAAEALLYINRHQSDHSGETDGTT